MSETKTRAAVIIPNWNGMQYLKGCLDSLRAQKCRDFTVYLVDNGSTDGSAEFVMDRYPEVKVRRFARNTGFCHAVNTGIRTSHEPYVILLNNDVVCDQFFVGELLRGIEKKPGIFSCQALMLSMEDPSKVDDAGDFYCALGWAFARGRGKDASLFARRQRIFAACAGAAVYRRSLLEKTGLFDERHFAYLEDIDLGYRAAIKGYPSYLIPSARVLHAGSGATGSTYNAFKVDHASRNSVYLIRKNMPLPQIILNLPFLAVGFTIKTVFFARRGYLRRYLRGLAAGLRPADPSKIVRFQVKNLPNYLRIQCWLWLNIIRRAAQF